MKRTDKYKCTTWTETVSASGGGGKFVGLSKAVNDNQCMFTVYEVDGDGKRRGGNNVPLKLNWYRVLSDCKRA